MCCLLGQGPPAVAYLAWWPLVWTHSKLRFAGTSSTVWLQLTNGKHNINILKQSRLEDLT